MEQDHPIERYESLNMVHARPMSKLKEGIDLVLVSHGVRGPSAAVSQRAHRDLVERLRALGRFNQIRWGYLTCEPYLRDVVADVESQIVKVLPMLMSDGYFSKSVIPEILQLEGLVGYRENGQQIIQCPPIGLSAMMVDVMAQSALAQCRENGLAANATTVVVVGHGSSKNDASRLALSRQVKQMRRLNLFRDIHDAYLEQAPDLPSVLQDISGQVLVIGYFANYGLHATEDVTRLLRQSESSAHYLGPVGTLAAISDVVIDCVDGAT